MAIFDHLSFLGKLLKELRQKHLKVTKEFGRKIFCVPITGFDVPVMSKKDVKQFFRRYSAKQTR